MGCAGRSASLRDLMRWPFSKKHPPLSIPPRDAQRWTVAEGDVGGGPLIVPSNDAARELAGHPDLPIKLGLAVPLNRPAPGGLPDADENAELGRVEDLIVERVLAAGVAVHAMSLTTGVMKEFVFYVAPGMDIATVHTRLRDEVSSHDVQCMAVKDPKWASYREFVPSP